MVLGVADHHDQQPQQQYVDAAEQRARGRAIQHSQGDAPQTAVQQPATQRAAQVRAWGQQAFDQDGEEQADDADLKDGQFTHCNSDHAG
ncbi:hypothetical protein D3C71_1910750 [compost metagenome]